MGKMTGGQVVQVVQVVWGWGVGGKCPSSVKTLDLAARQVSRQIWGLTVSDPALMYVDTTIAKYVPMVTVQCTRSCGQGSSQSEVPKRSLPSLTVQLRADKALAHAAINLKVHLNFIFPLDIQNWNRHHVM